MCRTVNGGVRLRYHHRGYRDAGGEARQRKRREARGTCMLNVLVTTPFTEEQLKPLRDVSPELQVTCEGAERANYSQADVLYAGSPPRDLARAPRLRWVQ